MGVFQEVEMAGQQPDPEFKAWFAGPWRELHGRVEIPGMMHASWDRKAAYLLWCMGTHYARDTGLDDWEGVLMGYIVPEDATAPPQSLKPDPDDARLAAGFGPNVGRDWVAEAMTGYSERNPPVNPDEDAACLPFPEGVQLDFDSAKW